MIAALLGSLLTLAALASTTAPTTAPTPNDDATIIAGALDRAGCIDCHGPEKQKGALRLDQSEDWEMVVVPEDAPESELFRRVILPVGHDDRMPPEGDGFTEAEILATLRWINQGAKVDEMVTAVEKLERANPAAERQALSMRLGARVLALAREGGPDTPLRVDFSRMTPPTAERLSVLEEIAPRVQELSFAGVSIDPESLAALPALPVLDRLYLERTGLDDDAVRQIVARAPALRYLNLHSTRVTSAILPALSGLQALDRLVVFGTRIDQQSLATFQDSRTSVRVTGNLSLPDRPFVRGGPRRLLIADDSRRRIALVRDTALGRGNILWEHPAPQIHDVQWLPPRRVLFQETWTRLLEIDTTTRKVVWSYDAAKQNRKSSDGPVEVHSFGRLPNGNTFIAESGPARIIEVDAQGQLVTEIPLQVDDPHPHHDTRRVRPTPGGTYLVAHERDGVVREYDRQGQVVWSYAVPLFGQERKPGNGFEAWGNQVFSAVRLPGGNTLIGTGNGHSVLEVNPAGEIVWHLKQDDLEGIRLAWVTSVQVLANGNRVIGNCHAGDKQPQLIEITPDKQVVWRYHDFEHFGNSVSTSWVIEDPREL